MASGPNFFSWLKNPFRRRRRKAQAKPLLLINPIDGNRRYNAVSRHSAKFQIGQVVRHRMFPFRGVIFDVDPQFANTAEWYESIPEEVRPRKDQPFYHLFAENERTHYVAYVSEQNLLPDESETPLTHPEINEWFTLTGQGTYELKKGVAN
ncbi:MAG: heat shock protein HspQ [Alphaproteobacteria bacterium]|nr:heat shock protein HspQ [Alphaproteobacteria bacterium]MBU2085604.1 heat shock protein HspQ [Alphaproteobacteria bacterium]MBU2141896.1 heat shock protein HspQ [Alphaproteobacteria bacterium]MBU2195732.1 heat shock protein HspQ [Alphaproteobacteria bacterium]